jgi:hypothetical protein
VRGRVAPEDWSRAECGMPDCDCVSGLGTPDSIESPLF